MMMMMMMNKTQESLLDSISRSEYDDLIIECTPFDKFINEVYSYYLPCTIPLILVPKPIMLSKLMNVCICAPS